MSIRLIRGISIATWFLELARTKIYTICKYKQQSMTATIY